MADPVYWRCFYCNAEFTEKQENDARLHFGDRMHTIPVCKVDPGTYREMERLLERYREEDSDMHRLLHRRESDHQLALRREEEKGYARGLQDGGYYNIKDKP
ncbi:MAG: hypothetical protein JWR85_4214 [Marmoricola sp.]|nr:hypothetical protein [Marmoricola sp.]